MRRYFILLFLFSLSLSCIAQKKEEGFDVNFNPTPYAPRYFVTTEQKDGRWYREAYYIPERSMAMQGWYKDSACKIPDGETNWFHPNKVIQSAGTYKDGKKSGTWLRYADNGMVTDSATYIDGQQIGIRLRWMEDGTQIDSTNFDGKGNGVQATWRADGTPLAAGRWIQDTAKNGRWSYYHPNGKQMAIEDYQLGKRISVSCFDIEGKPLADCEEREAFLSGKDDRAWRTFMAKNLNPEIPVRRKAPTGQYFVMIQFIVNSDGSIIDIKPLTKFGFGMEEEAMRVIRKSPAWQPAIQFGRPVKAYRKQPVTFAIE